MMLSMGGCQSGGLVGLSTLVVLPRDVLVWMRMTSGERGLIALICSTSAKACMVPVAAAHGGCVTVEGSSCLTETRWILMNTYWVSKMADLEDVCTALEQCGNSKEQARNNGVKVVPRLLTLESCVLIRMWMKWRIALYFGLRVALYLDCISRLKILLRKRWRM